MSKVLFKGFKDKKAQKDYLTAIYIKGAETAKSSVCNLGLQEKLFHQSKFKNIDKKRK